MTTHASSIDHLRLVVLIGSVRDGRVGPAVGAWMAAHSANRTDLSIETIDLASIDLPLSGAAPGGGEGSPIAAALEAADGFVIVTPEYNHSFPASLKNAIDWHHRQWMFKPVTFVSYGAASGGSAPSSSCVRCSRSCTRQPRATWCR